MFVKDLFCISPQRTIDESFFNQDVISYSGNKYTSVEPSYAGLIPNGLLRRMGKAVRMGIGAGITLVNNNPKVHGIILGTANGGLEDCIKFLNQIVKYEEGNLTPTNFIQSTPNSAAGNLAIMSGNTNYNITHVHQGLAFENALLDAGLLFEEDNAESVLVGGIEEISEHNYNIDFLSGFYKTEVVDSENLLQSKTKGTVCGEGAAMFILDKNINSGIRIVDIGQIQSQNIKEVTNKLKQFLELNTFSVSDIDAVMLGFNGDTDDNNWYNSVLDRLFPDTGVFTFKNLSGDYPTVSSFATWLSVMILKGKTIPLAAIYKPGTSDIRNILIYNSYRNQHGFILLEKK